MEDRHEQQQQQQAASATNSNINPDLISQGARVHAAWPPTQPPALTPRMNGASAPPQSQQDSQQLRQQYYPQTNGHPQTPASVAAPPPQQAPSTPQTQHDYRMPPGQQILPSVSLPPIQSYKPAPDGMQPPQYAPMNGEAQMVQHAPPPVQYGYAPNLMPANGQVMYSRDGYQDRRYSPPPLQPMHPYAPHMNGAMRLDPRQMSGGRHKKEIKRRTKTGCLTCRKRRIKCDERHPECRNCEKSKRECLGYDPIFKQQSGPAQIQPAPVSLQKSDTELNMTYPAPPYQGMDDMYAARPPPAASAPPALPYAPHPYGAPPAPPHLESQPGHPPGVQHYHPPFDPQRSESKA